MDLSRRTLLILGTGTIVTSIAGINVLADNHDTGLPGTPPPPPVPDLGPIPLADWTAARTALRIPADAPIVEWTHESKTAEEMFMGMAPGELLGIPQGATRYVDSADGFRAAGVDSVAGANGTRIPIVSTYKDKGARTWFAMARARRGIVGLGPDSVLTTTESGFTQSAQIPVKGSPLPGGGISPGRFYWTTGGAQGSELVGSQEKVLETEHADGYYGNFTMRGRDFGAVAYSAIAMKGGTAERLALDGAWRGFDAVPNGEAAAISVNGGRYLLSHCSTSPLDETGKRVGSSPIMVNNSPGGRWEYGDASQARVGMPTIWHSSGRHEWFDVFSRWGGPGVNLEQCLDGFEFVMTGGVLWPNRGGNGGHPSPDGIFATDMHIHLQALGRATITLTDVNLDQNIEPGKLCVQLYGDSTDPKKVRVTATTAGEPVPVVAYGKPGVVALAP